MRGEVFLSVLWLGERQLKLSVAISWHGRLARENMGGTPMPLGKKISAWSAELHLPVISHLFL